MSKRTYPTHAEYDLAVSYNNHFVLDPVLRAGTPRSRSGIPVTKGGQPLSYPGGFAKVYIVDSGGKTYALRVWLVEIPDAAQRYQIISEFIRKQQLPFFVDFDFISDGILVQGRRYPILRMEWVEGYSLRDFIGQNLGQPNLLKAAADKFCETAEALQKVHAAHGDLQADNMILRVSNGTVHYKLIDYDTLAVPGLLGKSISTKGLAAYQHPLREDSPIATEKDDFFSELAIYLCLRAIAEDSSLWSKFPAAGRDKELLFQGADYRSKAPTALFRQLYDMGGLVQKLAVILWNFSRCRSINQLVSLQRALELATKVEPTESTTNPPSSDFEKYLKSKLAEHRSQVGLPDNWLDDCAFRPAATKPAAATASAGSTVKASAGSEPSFEDVLAGIRLAQHPSTTPSNRPKIGAPFLSGGLVAFGVFVIIAGFVLLLIIAGKTPNNTTNGNSSPNITNNDNPSRNSPNNNKASPSAIPSSTPSLAESEIIRGLQSIQKVRVTMDSLASDTKAMYAALQGNADANRNSEGFLLGAHFFIWWVADFYSDNRSDHMREARDLALAEFRKWREQQQAIGISDRNLCELAGAPNAIMQRIADYADGKVAVPVADTSPDTASPTPIAEPSATPVPIFTSAPTPVENPSTPQPPSSSSRLDKYPFAQRTNVPGWYRSPFTGKLYNLRRVQDGGRVKDPDTGQFFRRPHSR